MGAERIPDCHAVVVLVQLNYIVLVPRDEGKTAADYSSYGQAVLPDDPFFPLASSVCIL